MIILFILRVLHSLKNTSDISWEWHTLQLSSKVEVSFYGKETEAAYVTPVNLKSVIFEHFEFLQRNPLGYN